MNQVIVSPIAPTTSGLDLSTTSMMGMVRYAGVLDIAFQPIVDIHTGRVFGFEALTRNVHALGFSSPTDFFDRCYDDGQLAAVEEYLITQAQVIAHAFRPLPTCSRRRGMGSRRCRGKLGRLRFKHAQLCPVWLNRTI